MKTTIFFLLLMASCSQVQKKPESTAAQNVSLTTQLKPSLTHQATFDDYVLNAPNFGLDQYHEGLKPYFAKDGTSQLCQPVAVATALISDWKFNPAGKNLKLKSLKAGELLDANPVIEELIECTKTNVEKGSKISNTANCLLDLGYEVRLITNWGKDGFSNVDQRATIEDRALTPQDIMKYLKTGYHILGITDFFTPDEKGKWVIGAGHVVYLNGYARQKNWPKDTLQLYMTDPDSPYSSVDYRKYQQVLLSKSATLRDLPAWAGNLTLDGGRFFGLNSRGFLTGLLIFKLPN